MVLTKQDVRWGVATTDIIVVFFKRNKHTFILRYVFISTIQNGTHCYVLMAGRYIVDSYLCMSTIQRRHIVEFP
jgi:hypothetical protein